MVANSAGGGVNEARRRSMKRCSCTSVVPSETGSRGPSTVITCPTASVHCLHAAFACRACRRFLLSSFVAANEHDVEGVVSLYGSDAEMADPTLVTPIKGRDALQRYYASMWAEIGDARLEVSSRAQRRPECCLDVAVLGQGQQGSWQAIGASYFRVENGLIISDHAVWDSSVLP